MPLLFQNVSYSEGLAWEELSEDKSYLRKEREIG